MENQERPRRAQRLSPWIAAPVALAIVAIVWTGACKKSTLPVAPIPDVSTIKIDPHFCEKDTATCERLCTGCSDKAQCFKSGGECGGAVAAITTIRDEIDRGPDIWIAGCHFQYRQNACAGAGAPWVGDWCNSDGVQIEEWFDRVCHDAEGDHYTDNCDTKCKQIGLGAGWCVPDKGFCPGGIDSAHCMCEKGSPAPPPPTNPS